jgi:hypothetical protein
MASNDYQFVTRWRVEGTLEEVSDVLRDPLGMVRWWPSFFRDAKKLVPGDENALGSVVEYIATGWLPYSLRWALKVVESNLPHGWTVEASGDLIGRGIWTLEQDGGWVNATYDWRVVADKPLLRYLSFALRPIFAANHDWVMSRGEESLILDLARRRAKTPRGTRGDPRAAWADLYVARPPHGWHSGSDRGGRRLGSLDSSTKGLGAWQYRP